jgi:hypothetical protein
MHETPNPEEEGRLKALTEREAIELMADDRPHGGGVDRAAVEHRLRANLTQQHRVTWIRVSDLISSGTGSIAGRGIDFEAELARRLRHPAETTRRAIRNRSSSLPSLDAFGRSRSRISRETLGRS